MPLPALPIVAATTAFVLVSKIKIEPADEITEALHDSQEEGTTISRSQSKDLHQVNLGHRSKKILKWGAHGPAFEFEANFLGRLRARRI